jgi:hypothetical protein
VLITAALAALSLQTAEDAAGSYQAVSVAAMCAVTLRPSAAQLPESNVTGQAASGFAFAAPGCPGGLSEAALWRLTLAEGELRLVDGAGETLFTGRLEDRTWRGTTPSGEVVTLRPR